MIVADVREDGTTIRLIGRRRAEHIAPVREEIAGSRAPTALDLEEVAPTDIDAVRLLVAAERHGIVLQHCAPFIHEMDRERVRGKLRERLEKGASMPTKPSIVFAHGIWADGSSFSKVIPALQAEGYEVVSTQNGLDTLEGDVAAVRRALGRVPSPAILVGHSYGGTVITAAGADDRVAGLVYIAALGPDDGETSQSLLDRFPTTDIFSHIEIADGRIWMLPDGIRYFAGDLSEQEQQVVWATQGV